MKISPEGIINPLLRTVRPAKAEKVKSPSFSNLLKSESAKGSASSSPADVTTLAEPQPLGLLNYAESQPSVVDRVGDLIDNLERYAQDLNDPSKSLKDIEPRLTDLSQSAESLKADMVTGPFESMDLKEIFDKIWVAINTETIKFRRGDYVPQA